MVVAPMSLHVVPVSVEYSNPPPVVWAAKTFDPSGVQAIELAVEALVLTVGQSVQLVP
jgi:hypothetical protein